MRKPQPTLETDALAPVPRSPPVSTEERPEIEEEEDNAWEGDESEEPIFDGFMFWLSCVRS